MEELFQKIVVDGVDLLKSKKFYRQATLVRKLKTLGIETTSPTLSNIIKGSRPVAGETLAAVKKGIVKLIEIELAYRLSDGGFIPDPNIKSTRIVEEYLEEEGHDGLQFYADGRLSIEEKVAFFSTAQEEIVEFGITLNTFSNYFFTRKESEFKVPIQQLLENGVILKCYLLDPECNEAKLYFNDRARVLPEELKSIEKIRTALERLRKIQQEFAAIDLSGKLEIYLYKHIPHNYFLIVDGEVLSNAKMAISHYLYGQLRANAPVVTFNRLKNRDLFRRYYQSYQALTKDARLYEPTVKPD